MASEDRHITRISDTEANFYSDGDLSQSAILTDGNEEWVYKNSDNSKLYFVANQKYRDGEGYAYCDVEFYGVTANGAFYPTEYIYHSGDTDNYVRYRDDRFTRVVGGVSMIDIVEDGSQDYVEINDANADVDFIVNGSSAANALFVQGSDGFVGVGTNSPDRQLHVEDDTATTNAVEDLLRLTKTCSGTATDGFGIGVEFELESSTATSNEIAATMEVSWDDEATRESKIEFNAMTLGTKVSMLRMCNDGIQFNPSNYDIDWWVETGDLTYALFVQASPSRVGIGTGTPDAFFHVEQTSAETSTAVEGIIYTALSSGTTANGFGLECRIELENSTLGSNVIAGATRTYWEDESDREAAVVHYVQDGSQLDPMLVLSSVSGVKINNSGNSYCDVRMIGSSNNYLFFLDASADSIGIGTNSPAALLNVREDGDSNWEVFRPFRIGATYSAGAITDGFGTGMEFYIKDTGGGQEFAGAIDAYWEDASDDDTDMVFYINSAGSEDKIMRLMSYKDATIYEGVVIDSGACIYFGEPGTNTSWRIRIGGTDMSFDRRESGSWVQKSTVAA